MINVNSIVNYVGLSNFIISKPVSPKMFMELCNNLYLMDDEKRRAWLDNLTENLERQSFLFREREVY